MMKLLIRAVFRGLLTSETRSPRGLCWILTFLTLLKLFAVDRVSTLWTSFGTFKV